MRKIVLILFLTVSSLANCQEQMDSLFYKSGETKAVNLIIDNGDSYEFSYPGETMRILVKKESLREVHYRSGRVDVFNFVDDSMYELRMAQVLKSGGRFGSKKPLRGVHRIYTRLVITEHISRKIEGDINSAKDLLMDSFLRGASAEKTYVSEHVDSGIHADLVIVDADDDGEMYGLLEYYEDGNDQPFLTYYLNGNGYRRGDTFLSRLNGGMYNCGSYFSLTIYR